MLTRARPAWLGALPGVRSRPGAGGRRSLEDLLADPRSYERQLDRLLDRHAFGRGMHDLREGEVSLASVAARRGEVARLIARTVSSGAYVPAPALLRTIRAGGKRRAVLALGLVDLLVHGVVSDALQEAIEPSLSPRLLSYRAGIPWWRGAQQFAAWIRHQPAVRRRPVGQCAVYVIRRDVSAYTDTIPVGDGSPLWPMVWRAFAGDGALSPGAAAVVRAVIRPAIVDGPGPPVVRDRGVPTGQPVSCVLFNLYLRDLDHSLASVPGAFYTRYSDDIVFAHPDATVVRQAAVLLEDRLASLGLTLNAGKSRDIYLTRAGHASPAWPSARGAQVVPLLGLQVGADGTVGLEPSKARELVRDIRRRALSAAAAGAGPDESARLATAVVRRALDEGDVQMSARAAPLLRHVVTDRRQLAELDHRIAREVGGVLVGDRSIRAFRVVPPNALRSRYGLPSLVEHRNGHRRKPPA